MNSPPPRRQIKAVIIARERDERDKLVQGGYLTKNSSHKDREYPRSHTKTNTRSPEKLVFIYLLARMHGVVPSLHECSCEEEPGSRHFNSPV